MKFCTTKRTHVSIGPAKFDVNRCNESPLRGEKPDFWPVNKFNTGSLPLHGILPVTRNKSITSKAMQYRQDIVTRMPITWMELITISIVTIRSIWHNTAAYFFVLENFRRKFANLVAPPTDGTTKRLVRCKAQRSNSRRKQRPNPCITGDANPSSNW